MRIDTDGQHMEPATRGQGAQRTMAQVIQVSGRRKRATSKWCCEATAREFQNVGGWHLHPKLGAVR